MLDPQEIQSVFGLVNPKVIGENLMASCPNAKNHAGGTDKHRSFGINLHTYKWQCYSCRIRGKNLKSLGYLMKVNIPSDLMLKLIRKPSITKEKERMKQFYDFSLIEPFVKDNLGAYEYLKNRGISMKAIKRFNVGYNKDTGSIVFPCIDWNKNLTGWVERNEIWDNRYGYKPEGVNRNYMIFGMDRDIELAFLVEGVVDALKLITWGFEAIAVNGNRLFEEQAKDISEHCKKVCIIPDNDLAGEALINDAKRLFKGVVETYISYLPEGIKDAGDMNLKQEDFIKNYRDNVQFLF